MARKLGAGVIGCGFIGQPHTSALAKLDTVKLVAVADIDEARAKTTAAKWGAEAYYSDAAALLDRKDIDFVCVTTANNMHAPLSIQAMEAGKHVMVQKPIALSLAEADAMIATSERTGKLLMSAFFEMFHPGVMKAKEIVDRGDLGQVFMMKAMMAWYMGVADWSVNNWRFDPKISGGGILMDGHIHHVPFFRHFTGTAVEQVFTVGGAYNSPAPVEDSAITLLKSSKAIAEVSGSNRLMQPTPQFGFPMHFKEHIELFGSEGCILIHTMERPSIRVYSTKMSENFKGLVEPEFNRTPFDERVGYCQLNPEEDPWVAMHRHFADCIVNEKRPLTTGVEGREALEIVQAGYESMKQGKAIDLPLR